MRLHLWTAEVDQSGVSRLGGVVDSPERPHDILGLRRLRCVSAALPPSPPVSDDGHFWWSGQQWVPFEQHPAIHQLPSHQLRDEVAVGVLKGIGSFLVLGLYLLVTILMIVGLVMIQDNPGVILYVAVWVLMTAAIVLTMRSRKKRRIRRHRSR